MAVSELDKLLTDISAKYPVEVVPLISGCGSSLGSAICRKEGEHVQFTPIADGSVEFGIEFETMPGFNPCMNNIGSVQPGVKNCNIVGKTTWPGGGTADVIIKYTVKSESGTCDLDPYLVLRR